MYIKLHVSSEALKAGMISRETIRKSVNHLVQAEARGMKPNPPPQQFEEIINLRKGLRTSETAFWGFNLSRMRARHDMFGYIKRYGPPQLFVTVSPDSAGTYSIAFTAGELSRRTIEEGNTHLLPNQADRKRIASEYPMQSALYFERVMTVIIEVLLGWDQKMHEPTKGGGIFGIVGAYGAAAKTQQSGDLHGHFGV
ncbi:hypothetical protein F441_09983 [Phytophthora nicotianae CJ01A1]|uniref:Helitron helicase-like domain-containing protein n=3 Tax=Phytophthora nicotianae TaxID=4792 RepID=W2GQQ0_PHYNI|nr:hypothetical protein L915_09834 [Phytophthora nicotianae]ETL38749.1 hypothetical protein L916_09741 [Phytophthora nicotianae]ETP15199.1 hypothetical protein F441_09983 [Phytophthora nicotianae CJ01A1]